MQVLFLSDNQVRMPVTIDGTVISQAALAGNLDAVVAEQVNAAWKSQSTALADLKSIIAITYSGGLTDPASMPAERYNALSIAAVGEWAMSITTAQDVVRNLLGEPVRNGKTTVTSPQAESQIFNIGGTPFEATFNSFLLPPSPYAATKYTDVSRQVMQLRQDLAVFLPKVLSSPLPGVSELKGQRIQIEQVSAVLQNDILTQNPPDPDTPTALRRMLGRITECLDALGADQPT